MLYPTQLVYYLVIQNMSILTLIIEKQDYILLCPSVCLLTLLTQVKSVLYSIGIMSTPRNKSTVSKFNGVAVL